MPTTTPYETQEEAFEGRIRSMGYFVGLVTQLAGDLGKVRATVAEMEAAGFPTEYDILDPVKQLERSATLQVEPKIATFMLAYQGLLEAAAAATEESSEPA